MASLSKLTVTVALATLFTQGCDRTNSGAAPSRGGPKSSGVVTPTPPSADHEPSTVSSSTSRPELHGPISFVDVAKYPRPGTAVPSSVRFSPDGKALTYLQTRDGTLERQLYALDIASGTRSEIFKPPSGGVREENLTIEQQLRRERTRTRGLGVTRYTWSKDSGRMIVPIAGDVWILDGIGATPRRVIHSEGEQATDPQLSKDGSLISYVLDDEVYVAATDGKSPSRQITKGARGTGKTHGLAEYIAQEEMSRRHGYWLSPDNAWLAFTEVDETHIPEYRITHQGNAKVGHGAEENHRYPFAGADNAKIRLGVVRTRGGKTRWIDLDGAEYLARVQWMPDGTLTAQTQNREQTQLRLLAVDPSTGRTRTILEEASETWVNLHHMLRPLEKPLDGRKDLFVWASESTGFRHLYVHALSGERVHTLTEGDWQVDSIVDIDESSGQLWFLGTRDGVTERHLYRVGLRGGAITKVTQAPGMHSASIGPNYRYYVDAWSSLEQTPTIELRELATGKLVHTLHSSDDPRVAELKPEAPKLVTLNARDGETLHGAVYAPDAAKWGPGPYPTLVSVYGGPHAQRVQNEWDMTVDMRAQFLRQQGYLVFKLDNRGSARRGLAFEGKIRHDMGNLEVQDQVDGVRWLAQRGLANSERVGMFGWSYGGYMSAMAVARAPETFKVGVAGAPVSSWDGYDTHYTERYMGTPQANAKGYEDSSVMTHAAKMTGSLLLVHGLIDENVHFRHTARLMNALIAEGKDFELQLFPDARHMPRKEKDRVYMERKVFDFILRKL